MEQCALCKRQKSIFYRGLCRRCWEIEKQNGRLDAYKDRRFKNPRASIVCQVCGNTFEGRSSRGVYPKYCSYQCAGLGNRAVPPDQEQEVIRLYTEGQSSREIAKVFDATDSTIRNVLKKHKIKRRPTWNKAYRHKINEHIFDQINSEESAYWLGMLYADGYVGQGSIVLALKKSDKDHLLKLRDFMQSDHGLFDLAISGTVGFRVHGQHLYDRLLELGIFVRRGKFDLMLGQLPASLHHHFIRGYLDGDGYITHIDATTTPNVGFCGQLDILTWIKSILVEKAGASSKPQIRQRRGIMEVAFGGRYQIKRILSYLYQDATIFLSRKEVRARHWLQLE